MTNDNRDDVKHCDVFLNLDDDILLKETVYDLIIKNIKPEWANTELNYELLTGGISNKILCCWNKLKNPNDRILFRIFGEKTDLIIDRKAEKECMKVLSQRGYAAPIYCTFSNGVAYGFVPGIILDVNTVREKQISALVAKRMAQIHSIKLDNSHFKKVPCLFQQIEKFINNLPDNFDDPLEQSKYESCYLSKSEVNKEYEILKRRILELNCSIVFCHNDLLLKNIIYDSEKDCVTFIDFEYGGYNYQAYDIADHFTEFAGTEDVDFSLYPDRDFQLWWLKCYLDIYRNLNKCPAPTSRDVEILYVQVNVLALSSHFLWSVWAIVQAKNSSIDFGYLQYGIDRLNEYFKLKPSFWNLTLPS